MFQEGLRFVSFNFDWVFDLIGNRNVGINVLNEPTERFAIQSLPQSHLLRDVAEISLRVADRSIIIFLVIVEPDFRQSIGVPTIALAASGELK